MLLTILYIFCASDKHEQVYGQLNASISELQKHCNMFRLPSVAILRKHHYYKTDKGALILQDRYRVIKWLVDCKW